MGCQQSKQQNVCKTATLHPIAVEEQQNQSVLQIEPSTSQIDMTTPTPAPQEHEEPQEQLQADVLLAVVDDEIEDVTALLSVDLAATITPQIQIIPFESTEIMVEQPIDEMTIVVDVEPVAKAEETVKKTSRRRSKKVLKETAELVAVEAVDKENSVAAARKNAANAAVIAAIIGSAPQTSALKQQAAPIANTNSSPLRADEKPKISFDKETMRKTAPKSAPSTTNLSRKQKNIIQQGHVSKGRRGPVASKWDKGGKSQMQTDKYLEMANAFERLLTNAATINAHLDTR